MGVCGAKELEVERASSSGTWASESQVKRDSAKRFPFVAYPNHVRNVWKIFKEVKVLGKGANATVARVKHRENKQEYALKLMPKNVKINAELFKQEYEILSTLRHNWIVGLCGVYIDRRNFYILQQLLTGGELFDRLRSKKHFSEGEAVAAMQQLIGAVSHMHAKNIVHRDLKLENAVYATPARRRLVIIDCGEATKVQDDADYDDFVCTPYYVAPELVRARKGWEMKAADVWSLGVCAYSLVVGGPPWWGRDSTEILRQIYAKPVALPPLINVSSRKAWCDSAIYNIKLSAQCRNFLRQMLRKNTTQRPTCNLALQHLWLGGVGVGRTVVVEAEGREDSLRTVSDTGGSLRTVSDTNDETAGLFSGVMPTSL